MTATDRLVAVFADSGATCAQEGVLDAAMAELDARLEAEVLVNALRKSVWCNGNADRLGICKDCGKLTAHPPVHTWHLSLIRICAMLIRRGDDRTKGGAMSVGHDPGGCLFHLFWCAHRLPRRLRLRVLYHLRGYC